MGLFNLLICIWMMIIRGASHEREKGTVSFAVTFTVLTTLIQVLFLALALLLSLAMPSAIAIPSNGLFCFVMLQITFDSFTRPDQATPLCCLPIQIRAIWCPFIFLAIFTFMLRFDALGMWCGFFVGVLYARGYLKFAEPGIVTTQNIENKICGRFRNRAEFIEQSDAIGFEIMG